MTLRGAPRATPLIGLGMMLFAVSAWGNRAWAARSAAPFAFTAHVLSVSDSSELHVVKAVGNTLIEEGSATGTLPGVVRIRLNINVETSSAASSFTLHTRGGTLIGHAAGTASPGHGGWESFAGKMWLDRGTGRYARASGSGHMYGALFRRTDRLRVQTIGRLRY
jgi:hypothetical protein